MYEITGNSLKYFEKERNGDNFYFGEIEADKIVIAIVADGVSNQPCDWLASEILCSKFLELFKHEVILDLKTRVHITIEKVNRVISSTEGECNDMRTTMSLLVWKYDTNECYISNIGDSRIYRCENEKLDLITKDESIVGTKTIHTQIGRRVVETSKLTNTLGSLTPKIEVKKIDFKKGTTFVLASDGFYGAKKSSFSKDMQALACAPKLDEAFNETFSNYDWSAKDDMTAIVIRNNN